MSKKPKQPDNTIVANKKARFAYQVVETFEAGIALEGWEVKSIRHKQVNIADCYIKARTGELWVIGMQITPLATRSTHVTSAPDRTRRLLMHKKEINRLESAMKEQRMTCIIRNLYWQRNLVKCSIALAKGKQQHDKRQSIKKREWQRSQERLHKHSHR